MSATDFNYMNKQRHELKEQFLPNSYRESNNQSVKGKERVFSLLESIVLEENTSFYLTYESNEAFSLLLDDHEYYLPAVSVPISAMIPFKESVLIGGFKLNPTSEDCTVELLDIGTLHDNLISDLNEKIILTFNSENDLTLKNNSLDGGGSLSVILNSDNISDDFDTFVRINDVEEYQIKTRHGLNQFWFYDLPVNEVYNVNLGLGHTRLESLEFNVFFEDEEAIYIDLEEFISLDPQSWRQADFEFFRWDLFPNMLLFDTLSYDIQAAFFKRLAFFTEKKNYVGTLLSDEDLYSLHGWNAHDYKSDDISRFFNEALKSDFSLNNYELLLKEILLNNGVLIKSGDRVRPGEGGMLSISQSSSDQLRWLFMTHECYHGVFFSSDEFILEVTRIWNDLADEERDFWRIFLDMYGYNVNDEYLLINEFQAYLMQQDTSLADSYFREKINWILSKRPHLQRSLGFLLSEYGDTFTRSAEAVEHAAYSLTGIRAGDLVLKRKK